MAVMLRVLGVLVIGLGLATAALAAWGVATDQQFAEVSAAYARHPTHALFQADYLAAAARHYGLVAAVIAGLVGGLTLGTILLALGEVLRRLPQSDPRRSLGSLS